MLKEAMKNKHHLMAFDKVVEYIEQHLNEEISLESLAEISNTSKFHFHRLFKEYFKESLSDYIKKRRLTNAAFQLVDTKRKIEDIALELNYSTIGSFTRAFTKQFKVAPAEYRRKKILMPSQVTPKISLDRLIYNSPNTIKTVFPETKLIGFKLEETITEKSYYAKKDFFELYWNFMNILKENNYPVKDGKYYTVLKLHIFEERPNGGFYREYECFQGVLYNGDPKLSHLPQLTINETKCMHYSFKGAYSEFNKFLWLLYEKHFPNLPFKIDMSYLIRQYTIGLNGELLDSDGNLDYDLKYNHYINVKYKNRYYNSPEAITNFYIPYYDE